MLQPGGGIVSKSPRVMRHMNSGVAFAHQKGHRNRSSGWSDAYGAGGNLGRGEKVEHGRQRDKVMKRKKRKGEGEPVLGAMGLDRDSLRMKVQKKEIGSANEE